MKISIWLSAASVAFASGCARDERSARLPQPVVLAPEVAANSSLGGASPVSNSSASPRSSSGAPTADAPKPDPSRAFTPPATVVFPTALKPNEKLPLLVVLHGYGVPSALLVVKAGLSRLADEKRFAYLVPEGNRDSANRPFWNAGPSCCSIDAANVDDVGRLSALIQAALEDPKLDPTRVYVIGYSNGGFMAHRLACAIGDRLTAVISISGAAPGAGEACKPSKLAVLEIHGVTDPIVRYGGGRVFDRSDFAEHPSALDSMQSWAARLGCSGAAKRLENRDLEPSLPGAETEVLRFDGCRGAVELWSVRGGAHYIALEPAAFEAMWAFLQSPSRTVK
jgi:polyhydroxybutyrate depolymerase